VPSDAPEIAALDFSIFGESAYSIESWKNEIANAAGKVLVAKRGEQRVAFVSALRGGDDLEIRKIGVISELRRQGIARHLIRHILTDEKVLRCLIDVSAGNDSGILFYQSLGFRELARRKKYYADGSDAIVMVRQAL
jgi:ribosomal protein S18 acetylase RimI-like enzyme